MTGQDFLTLLMLILLQAVLGFDNLLYISLESKKAPQEKQNQVRLIGIGLAMFLRIALLFALTEASEFFQKTDVFGIDSKIFTGHFNIDAIITLFGGGFIIYTAIKEIFHMVGVEHSEDDENQKKSSIFNIIMWIVIMNLVFSFDSILSAMALTENFLVMSIAIVISGVLMIVMSKTVSEFLKKNRLYEILGLFILFIVGILLVSEGGHKAHISFYGYKVEAMSKATFYFVIGILVIVDIIQGKFQKKMLKK